MDIDDPKEPAGACPARGDSRAILAGAVLTLQDGMAVH
jgi:hypothetical protein